jgi:crotonobetainyl-CoA:carnitine CoA-transferase CaiB-like acyl-CoA transferase
MSEGALSGIRVIECAHFLNGPFCGRILAELGAEVIKVEPPWGEEMRHYGPRLNGETYEFLLLNAGKKCITLNLKHPEGKKIMLELVARSDVFFENYSPGSMDRLGLGYEDLKKVNNRIIYASSTGYGYNGPYKDYPAFDFLIQGLTGHMTLNGPPESPPTRSALMYLDFAGGTFTALSIIAALYRRNLTGESQRIDISLYDIAHILLLEHIPLYLQGKTYPKTGNRHLTACPHNAYKAKDGYVCIVAFTDTSWKALLKVIGREDLIDHPDYNTMDKRSKKQDEIDEIIQDWVKEKSVEEVVNLLRNADIPTAPVRGVESLLKDPHTLAREMLIDVKHPTLGKVKVLGSVFKMSRTPGKVNTAGYPLGYHNEEVYCKLLGYSKEKLERLKKEKVI